MCDCYLRISSSQTTSSSSFSLFKQFGGRFKTCFFLWNFQPKIERIRGRLETLVKIFEIEQMLYTGVDLESKTVYHISLQVQTRVD